MKEIKLRNCEDAAIVSDEDFEFLSNVGWFKSGGGYAQPTKRTHPGEATEQYPMHRVVVERVIGKIPDQMEVDHINRDKLDNRRENLRICTTLEQARNKGKSKLLTGGISKYKGVHQNKSRSKPWRAQILANGVNKYLGTFVTEIAAAAAYNKAAIELHGEFAALNDIPDNVQDANPQPIIHNIRGKHSQYKGVYRDGDSWKAQLSREGKTIYLGAFVTEEAAASAYNRAAREYFGDSPILAIALNDVPDNVEDAPKPKRFRNRKNSSGYKGVYKSGAKWMAVIDREGKTKSIGTFATPEEAARAYDKAIRELYGDAAPVNFPD